MPGAQRMPLAEINALDEGGFVALLGMVFEHSPWVAQAAWKQRPFESIEVLHEQMTRVVLRASRPEQLALILAHPELAGSEAKAGTLTLDSTGEQGRLGFTALGRAELERIAGLNRAYREKFGFACIVALRLHASRESVIAEMERRRHNGLESEIANALEQIGHIARGRLDNLIREA